MRKPWRQFLLELLAGAACAAWVALIKLHVLGAGPGVSMKPMDQPDSEL